MAILPILFIVFGLGEVSKVVLIVFGIAPFIVRDLQQRVQELPREQIIKAQTLAGSSWQIILRVILPQVLPRLIDAVRLSLGAAWLFLIAAEAIAATEGLGYRIFLVRRYLAMDVILPYVAWITLLAYLTDLGLQASSRGDSSPGTTARSACMTPRIAVRNLWKEYGDQVVLERLNLEVQPGEFCTIVGASGCGKTTFLRLLLGEEAPTRGRILLDGEPLPAEPGPDRGIVFQRYSVFPHLTVLHNVLLGLELRAAPLTGRLFGAARREARERARQMLEAVGLGRALDKYPTELSGGMQQRLALAQSLVMHPRILLLDEPFGALDPGIRADMHELVGRLWRENDLTVFMITHDLKEGFHLGTRLLVFDKLRHDPDAPNAYGAGITYDLPVERADQRIIREIETEVAVTEAAAIAARA